MKRMLVKWTLDWWQQLSIVLYCI